MPFLKHPRQSSGVTLSVPDAFTKLEWSTVRKDALVVGRTWWRLGQGQPASFETSAVFVGHRVSLANVARALRTNECGSGGDELNQVKRLRRLNSEIADVDSGCAGVSRPRLGQVSFLLVHPRLRHADFTTVSFHNT